MVVDMAPNPNNSSAECSGLCFAKILNCGWLQKYDTGLWFEPYLVAFQKYWCQNRETLVSTKRCCQLRWPHYPGYAPRWSGAGNCSLWGLRSLWGEVPASAPQSSVLTSAWRPQNLLWERGSGQQLAWPQQICKLKLKTKIVTSHLSFSAQHSHNSVLSCSRYFHLTKLCFWILI